MAGRLVRYKGFKSMNDAELEKCTLDCEFLFEILKTAVAQLTNGKYQINTEHIKLPRLQLRSEKSIYFCSNLLLEIGEKAESFYDINNDSLQKIFLLFDPLVNETFGDYMDAASFGLSF